MLTKEKLLSHMLSTGNILHGESLAETSANIELYHAQLWEQYASDIEFHDIDQDLVEAAIRELRKG